jgi:cell division protein FtsL
VSSLGFFYEKGFALFLAILSLGTFSLLLWNSSSVSEIQKYFGVTLLIIVLMFFILTISFEYSIEQIRQDCQKLKDQISNK